MAESLDVGVKEFARGDMEVVQHVKTYDFVMALIKWGMVALAAALTLLIMWLCARAGFFPSLVVAVIVAVLGAIFWARSRGH